MSLKDGPTENPWRTLIWPLARDSQALYHAISSMTAFHMSQERPELRMEGIEHMRKSVRLLSQGFAHGNILPDAALGTTLVLAFSEAFDRHISTGIAHLRGARVLLSTAIPTVMSSIDPANLNADSFRRLQFLHNVWVYLDVLARLTSDADEGGSPTITYQPLVPSLEVDPLLGCAATLFPLIGQAACIVQRVRAAPANSAAIITAAMDLRGALEAWAPERYYQPIEDPTSDVEHCVGTAEAYRWATLLYLRQAVPELRMPSAHALADRVMRLIAAIPHESRTCIVHIFPLLAAGCEADGAEERGWVRNRWAVMSSRMWIGNVDRAWEVVQEVWRRRDAFRERRRSPPRSAEGSPRDTIYGSPLGSDFEFQLPAKRRFPDAAGVEDILSWDLGVFESGLECPKGRLGDHSLAGRPYLEMTPGARSSPGSDILHEHKKGDYEYEVSIKGKLHWLGVMKDWGWEGTYYCGGGVSA